MRSVPELPIQASTTWVVFAASLVLLAASHGPAAAIPEDPGDNDSFDSAQIITFPDAILDGQIDPLVEIPDLSATDQTLIDSQVFFHVLLQGETPGDPFIAWTDNSPGEPPPNTRLGRFDLGFLMDDDDDSSHVGDGNASALLGNVNADGTIELRVTGSADTSFNGSHNEAGQFDLLVSRGQLDLDFFSWEGLKPGSPFLIVMTTADHLTTLVQLDDDGNPGDTAFGFPECLEGDVPPSGILNFAVAGGEDHDADGFPSGEGQFVDERIGIGTGTYRLELTPEPEPGIVALTALVVLGKLARRRR